MRLLWIPLALMPFSFVSTIVFAAVPASALVNERQRAVQCLASAISYEAANEPVEGKEAVAQVILNRVRHPAYPKTVCGVVFQGATRKTGCQFTFTCDGSLSKPRSFGSMSSATMVAERVLSGIVSSSVGGATHYHADYVTPYWASSLIKVTAIGAHLFYRLPGAPDSAAYIVPGTQAAEPQITELGSLPKPSVTRDAKQALPHAPNAAFAPWGLPILASPPLR